MLRHRLHIHTNFQAINDSNTRTAMPRPRRSTFNTFVVFIVLMICYFPYLAAYMVRFTGKAGEALDPTFRDGGVLKLGPKSILVLLENP